MSASPDKVGGAGGSAGNRPQIEFLFRDVNVHIKGTQILQDVSGIVNSGEVLAVMGPSGSGKTTLLNALAGRTVITSGEITLDGQPMVKKVRKRTCYVLQEDIFLSKLTLWETLYFAAMVYLPEKIPRTEKLSKIDEILDVLDLNKCRDTVVGDQFVRGLSGGEKKRLSIACELIKDPDVMLMDEPTSGLDSSTAYTLMLLLKKFTEQSGKAVVVSIHQPSSQIFHLFTHLLLLAEGQIAFFGDGRNALSFFEELDLICEPHYSPADFILETVKKDKCTVQRITDLAEKKRHTDLWPARLRHTSKSMSHMSSQDHEAPPITPQALSGSVVLYTDSNGDVMLSLIDHDAEKAVGDKVMSNGLLEVSDTTAVVQGPVTRSNGGRWATGFFMQFKMLNWRTYKQARSRMISKYNIINTCAVTVFVSLLWFQLERTHENIKSRTGYLFFMSVYWSFMPIFDAITSFPAERPVMMKERAAGAYRLSAFFFAKMSTELGLTLLLPTFFCTVTYWMAGMRGAPQFFATLAIVLLQNLSCQGIGYVIGAAVWDFQMCLTTASIIILYGLLSAGYYVSRLPSWLTWSRYLSVVCYPYSAMCLLELGDLQPLPCTNVTNFELPMCNSGSNTTLVPPKVILEHYGIDLPLHCYISTMVIELFLWRIVAYFALKYKKKPH